MTKAKFKRFLNAEEKKRFKSGCGTNIIYLLKDFCISEKKFLILQMLEQREGRRIKNIGKKDFFLCFLQRAEGKKGQNEKEAGGCCYSVDNQDLENNIIKS